MSAWLDHVKKTMKLNPSKSFKEVLKLAKKTYKKGASTVEYAITGKKATKSRSKGKKGNTAKKGKATRGKKVKRGKTSKRSKSSKKGGGDKPGFDVYKPLSVDSVRQGITDATGQTTFSDRQLENVTGFNDKKRK